MNNSTIIKPEQNTSILVNLQTYLSTSLSNEHVHLEWMIFQEPEICPLFDWFFPCRRERKVLFNGTMELITNSTGMVEYLFVPPTDSPAGAQVEFQILYFAPTREMLQKKITIPIAVSETRVILTPIDINILPGKEFTVRVEVFNGTANMAGLDVSVNVYEWEGYNPDLNSLPPLGSQISIQKCKISTKFFSFCTFTVPKMMRYAIVGSTKDSQGNRIYGNVVVGKTYQEWQKSPILDIVNS